MRINLEVSQGISIQASDKERAPVGLRELQAYPRGLRLADLTDLNEPASKNSSLQ